jgi:cytochrome c oxidase subunit 2
MLQEMLYLPPLASAHGGALDRLTLYVHLLMALLFVGWSIYFVVALMRFRAAKHPKADPAGVKSHTYRYAEYGVIFAESVLLLGFAFPLWAARTNGFPNAADSTIVRVIGQQFAWNIHYPGPDGTFGATDPKLIDPQSNPIGLDHKDAAAADDVVTVNQLHLPVGKPAIVYLSSLDVIHSFGLNELRVKQDAIPGMQTPVWFVPTVTTDEMRTRQGNQEFTYEINCAQLCGLGHYRMRGYLTVDTAEQYQAWMDAEQQKLKEGGGADDVWGS